MKPLQASVPSCVNGCVLGTSLAEVSDHKKRQRGPALIFIFIVNLTEAWGSEGIACGCSTKSLKLNENWASLVVYWLRIRLPVRGTQFQYLVWEDPPCRGAAKPMSHIHTEPLL